jgi:hypothetical protein
MTAPATMSFSSLAFMAVIRRVHAAHLPGADADGGAVARKDYGVDLTNLHTRQAKRRSASLPPWAYGASAP